jgi:hypothetical protein
MRGIVDFILRVLANASNHKPSGLQSNRSRTTLAQSRSTDALIGPNDCTQVKCDPDKTRWPTGNAADKL